MNVTTLGAGALIIASVAACPATAQTVSVTVKNNYTNKTISLYSNACINSTCSPSPPSSIAIGATSAAFGAVAGSGQYSPLLTTKWNTNIGTKVYGGQFQASVSVGPTSCNSPVVSAVAFSGVYPSPTCTVLGQSVGSFPSCNLTAAFSMAN